MWISCAVLQEHGLGNGCCRSCHDDSETFADMWEMHGLYDPSKSYLDAPLIGNICCQRSRDVTDEQAWELYQRLCNEAAHPEQPEQERDKPPNPSPR